MVTRFSDFFPGGIKIGNLLFNPTELKERVEKQNISITPDAIDDILNATFDPQAVS
jgi:hypothetical protein